MQLQVSYKGAQAVHASNFTTTITLIRCVHFLGNLQETFSGFVPVHAYSGAGIPYTWALLTEFYQFEILCVSDCDFFFNVATQPNASL